MDDVTFSHNWANGGKINQTMVVRYCAQGSSPQTTSRLVQSFCTTHPCAQHRHTDIQTMLRVTSVVTGCICALCAGDAPTNPHKSTMVSSFWRTMYISYCLIRERLWDHLWTLGHLQHWNPASRWGLCPPHCQPTTEEEQNCTIQQQITCMNKHRIETIIFLSYVILSRSYWMKSEDVRMLNIHNY